MHIFHGTKTPCTGTHIVITQYTLLTYPGIYRTTYIGENFKGVLLGVNGRTDVVKVFFRLLVPSGG